MSFNHKPTYTVSAIETYFRCEKEYELKFLYGIEAVSLKRLETRDMRLETSDQRLATTMTLSARRWGILVHEVLQFLDFPSLSNRDTVIGQALINQHIRDPEGQMGIELKNMAEKMMGDDKIRKIFGSSGTLQKEIPFLIDLDRFYIRGKMDAFIQSETEAILLDYKTDQVTGLEEAQIRAQAYEGQMAAYALAAFRILKSPVIKTILLFVGGPHLVEHVWTFKELGQTEQRLHTIHGNINPAETPKQAFHYPADLKNCRHCPYFGLDYCGVRDNPHP